MEREGVFEPLRPRPKAENRSQQNFMNLFLLGVVVGCFLELIVYAIIFSKGDHHGD